MQIRPLAVRFLLLTLILWGMNAIDFAGLALNPVFVAAPLSMLLVAMLDTAVTLLAVSRSRWHGWPLVVALFLAFFGLKIVLTLVEAVYLTAIFTPELVRAMLIGGFFTAAVYAPLVVVVNGRWHAQRGTVPTSRPRAWRRWLWAVPLGGFIYAILFVAAGALLFQPLARALDEATAVVYFGQFEPPSWFLMFLVGRGLLWVLLTLPLIVSLRGRTWRDGLAMAFLFSVLMADGMLLPNDIPPTILVAHLLEVFVANFLFGWILVWLLAPRTRLKSTAKQAVHMEELSSSA